MAKIIGAVVIVVLAIVVVELYFGFVGLLFKGDSEPEIVGEVEVKAEEKGDRFATMCRDCDELEGYATLDEVIQARDRHEQETGHQCDWLDFERPQREKEGRE